MTIPSGSHFCFVTKAILPISSFLFRPLQSIFGILCHQFRLIALLTENVLSQIIYDLEYGYFLSPYTLTELIRQKNQIQSQGGLSQAFDEYRTERSQGFSLKPRTLAAKGCFYCVIYRLFEDTIPSSLGRWRRRRRLRPCNQA